MDVPNSTATVTQRPSRPRSFSRRAALLAAALLPFGWSIYNRVCGSEPAAAVEPPERPGLVFHQHMVNLGKVDSTPVVGARFAFTNRGAHRVKIVAAKPSCGCLKPRIAKTEYAPGESGMFLLPVQTPNQKPGPHEYQLTVRYTDPKPREAVLIFKVTLPEKQLVVRPRALAVYQLGGRATEWKIHVTDYPKLGLKLTGVTCNSPYAAVKLGSVTLDAYGYRRHEVVVNVPADVPPGRHRGLIEIATDDPRYRTIKVPLIISGGRGPSSP